ncbi:hypothetical protein K6119_14665 [Paracrocinitomix mangrovi]|uniref:hypothetical protein n=1 Tax=Paracrocinitomix mangrovi TaxID=2862509 RepID=UPI001C8F0F8E|nr:hypothetical protein [Paracrocinitomix mangrovi]UKN00975.1 hypothetical protein K6119_14665 [Paracrocinitomix mangrovi]
MKSLTYIIALIITAHTYAHTTIEFVDKYRPKTGSFKALRVPMSFDSDSITRVKPRTLDIGTIYRVDYVATSDNSTITSYQHYLNRKRWESLRSFLNIDKDVEYDKRIIYQTNQTEAKELFHGFVVYFRPSASKMHEESMTQLVPVINRLAGTTVDDKTTSIEIKPATEIDTVYLGDISSYKKSEIERDLFKRKYIVEWGYDSIGRKGKYHNTFYIMTKAAPALFGAFSMLADRSVFNMLSRTKVTDKTLVVTDMTGSMYPYYSQIIVLHALKMAQGKKVKHVFFNDGDATPDHEKEIGKTGGLYSVKTSAFLPVYRKMEECMKGGYGGDGPENNFEAVKHGIKRYEDVDNVLLICDNWAVPRDNPLLHTINHKIDFIMCGTELGINPRYIDLARENQGRIMTIEHSIKQLECFDEGDEINIKGEIFKLKNGRFFKKEITKKAA